MDYSSNFKDLVGQFVYTPSEATAFAMQEVRQLEEQRHRALRFPIPKINTYFRDLLPGQICAIIAQTSHNKSGLIDWWAEKAAAQLMEEGRQDEVVIVVKVEDTIEEQVINAMAMRSGLDSGDIASGNVIDWGRLNEAATYVGTVPIYRVGESLARSSQALPELYMTNVMRCLDYLIGVDGAKNSLLGKELTVGAIFWDYLQAFPYDPEIKQVVAKEQLRRLQVAADIREIRRGSQRYRAPSVVGVQAKQKLDGAPGPNMLLPGDYDGMETAAIAQWFDRIVTQWMPKRTHTVGSVIEHNGYKFLVEEDCIFMKIAKQRGRLPSGKTWKCRINFSDGSIVPVTDNEPRAD